MTSSWPPGGGATASAAEAAAPAAPPPLPPPSPPPLLPPAEPPLPPVLRLLADRHTRQRRQAGAGPQRMLVGMARRGLPARGLSGPNNPSLPELLLLLLVAVAGLPVRRWVCRLKAALLREAAAGATAGRRATCSTVAVCSACSAERRQHCGVPTPLQGSVARIACGSSPSPAGRPLAACRRCRPATRDAAWQCCTRSSGPAPASPPLRAEVRGSLRWVSLRLGTSRRIMVISEWLHDARDWAPYPDDVGGGPAATLGGAVAVAAAAASSHAFSGSFAVN